MSSREIFNSEFSRERLSQIFAERLSEGHTVGKDGVPPSYFGENLEQEISRILRRVSSRQYSFTNFKQKLILKGPGRFPREISIATVRDRLTLRALTNVLMRIFEDALIPPAHHIIEDASNFVKTLDNSYSFIQIDVKDFYPSVLHDHLISCLRSRVRYSPLLDLVSKAVKTPTGEASSGSAIVKGIPQGLSISNILSSIYMLKFDEVARRKFIYFRYVDDILIICLTKDANRNFRFLKNNLTRIGLECHPLESNSKTKIVPIEEGVDYLGYHLTPEKLSVRRSSYRKIMQSLMGVMTSAKYSTNHSKILLRLNLKITGCVFDGKRMGWMFFFSKTEDIQQLRRLDFFVNRVWRRLGMERYGRPKRFVKAYHEIRFNFAGSRYIPRFDDYSINEKIELVSTMLNLEIDEVANWTVERLNRQFFRLVKREVADLENDMTPVS